MLDTKLQLKPGQTIAVVNAPAKPPLKAQLTEVASADALLLYSPNVAKLREQMSILKYAGTQGKLTWVAYPKASQLNTDLNRDSIRTIANDNGLDPVRQIALDDVWAMRLKTLPSN